MDITVVGMKFRQDFRVFESQYPHIALLQLEREPTNPYDPRAIKVIAEIQGTEMHIGYIPKNENRDIDPQIIGSWLEVTPIRCTPTLWKFRVESDS